MTNRPNSDIVESWSVNDRKFSVFVHSHKRTWKCPELVEFYGASFCISLVGAWARATLTRRAVTVAKAWASLKRYLLAIVKRADSNEGGPYARFIAHLRDRSAESLDVDLMENVTESILNRIRNKLDKSIISTSHVRTRSGLFYAIVSALRYLSEVGYLPTFDFPRGMKQEDHGPTTPSLSELTHNGRAAVPVKNGLSLDVHIESVLSLSETRLDELRSCLEQELWQEYQKFKYGLAVAADKNMPSGAEIEKCINDTRYGAGLSIDNKVRKRLEVIFQGRFSFPDIVIRWAISQTHRVQAKSLTEVQRALLRIGGGGHQISRHLEATKISTNACIGILLIDTAFNLAVLEDLAAQPTVSTLKRGKITIETLASQKARARNRVVDASIKGRKPNELHMAALAQSLALPMKSKGQRISGGEAVRIYTEMTEPLRKHASSNLKNHFWLIGGGRSVYGGPVSGNLISGSTQWWPEFIGRHRANPIIGGLPIARNMIRTTVLQIKAGRGGFDQAIAQNFANHKSSSTTNIYTDSPHFRAQLSAQMRLVSELWEAALVKDIPSAPERLGITKDELILRVETGLEAGIDFVCVEDTKSLRVSHPDPTCNPVDPCTDCPFRRFAPNEENFATLYLAHTALMEAENRIALANTARWRRVWLPWRAYAEGFISKLMESSYKVRFLKVSGQIDRMLRDGAISLPVVA